VKFHLAAAALIALGVARIAATYPVLFLTTDEPIHFACGLEYLSEHVYRYEPQHPPLARALAALLPYLAGARPAGEPLGVRETEVVATRSGNPRRFLTLMRIGILPFFVLASLVVYLWARHGFGGEVGVMATALFTLTPAVLAHSGLATTDMALTACLGAAFYALLRWAESPTWPRTALLAVTAAAGLLAKFSFLAFFPTAALLALIGSFATVRADWKTRVPKVAAAAIAVGLMVWAAYWFSFGYVARWDMRLPAPAFWQGIDAVLSHNDEAQRSYLLGEYSETGRWYFFPVALAVKTPIAFLALLGVGVWVCWQRRAKLQYWLPAALALGVLLPAMAANINIGLRHVLPVYMAFSIVAALGLRRLLKGTRTRLVAAGLVLWLGAAGLLTHPDYLSYFNELVPAEREKVLVDSDLEWGQDGYRLAKRLRALGATKVSMGSEVHVSDEMLRWSGLPPIQPINPVQPAEGWTVVNPTLDKTTEYGLNHKFPGVEPWYRKLQPKERVGALILYYVPPKILVGQAVRPGCPACGGATNAHGSYLGYWSIWRRSARPDRVAKSVPAVVSLPGPSQRAPMSADSVGSVAEAPGTTSAARPSETPVAEPSCLGSRDIGNTPAPLAPAIFRSLAAPPACAAATSPVSL